MPEYTFVGTLQSTVKCFSLWNGTSNDAAPANWFGTGFDDSGWSFSANPPGSTGPSSGAVYPNGAGSFDLAAGSQEGVAPFTTVPSTNAQWLNRWYFIPPALPYEAYLLDKRSNGGGASSETVVNGTASGTLQSAGVPLSLTITNISDALTGGTNLIAWRTNDLWPSTGYAAYHSLRLVFYVPDPGGRPTAWGTIVPGVNDEGVLGTLAVTTILEPTYMDVSNLPDPDDPQVVKIASNGRTTVLLTNRGRLYACGDNDGVMIFGNTAASSTVPVEIGTGAVTSGSWCDVQVGGDSIIGLTRHGGVWTMGLNSYGSCGNGNTNPVIAMDSIGTLDHRGALFVAGGSGHLAYATDTLVSTCGDNTYGQLGVGDTTVRTSFTPVNLALSSDQISMLSACESATIFTKGANTYGMGRAQFGSLDFDLYDAGTGPNHIVTSPTIGAPFAINDETYSDQSDDVATQFFGAMTLRTNIQADLGSGLQVFRNAQTLGDGTPYGGAGDGAGTTVYGTEAITAGGVLAKLTSTTDLTDVFGIAESGGLVNEWASGDSRATLGAFGRAWETQFTDSLSGVALSQAVGSQTQYLWPMNDPTSIYLISADVRRVQVVVQNVAGPGGGTVTANLQVYDGPDTVNDIVFTTSSNVPLSQSRTLLADNRLGLYGLRVWLTYSFAPPRPNTVNATLTLTGLELTNRLWTWGYGGYGQMGNNTTTASNLYAISQNGLTGVSQVCIARRVAFAIAETGAVTQVGRGRSWAQVIG